MHAPAGGLDRVGEVWEGHRFDLAALERHCRVSVPGFLGPLDCREFHGGASNPTFLLTDRGTGVRFVLRKQPSGTLLRGAHAVDREARVMRALAGTAVPVPPIFLDCADAGLIGTPFYLMEFVEGRVYRDNRFSDMTREERRQAYAEIARTLAALHALDPAMIGLAGFGRADGYHQRQIARWTGQYRAAETERIESMERLIDTLHSRIPCRAGAAVVHGDFRQENLMFATDAPRLVAVLDWELSTLGDPLADLAFFCLFYHADFMHWGSARTIDFESSGIPEESRFVDDYLVATDRSGIEDWSFHLAFAAFRLAAIAQGVRRRAMEGATAHRGGEAARQWADLAWALLDR